MLLIEDGSAEARGCDKFTDTNLVCLVDDHSNGPNASPATVSPLLLPVLNRFRGLGPRGALDGPFADHEDLEDLETSRSSRSSRSVGGSTDLEDLEDPEDLEVSRSTRSSRSARSSKSSRSSRSSNLQDLWPWGGVPININ